MLFYFFKCGKTVIRRPNASCAITHDLPKRATSPSTTAIPRTWGGSAGEVKLSSSLNLLTLRPLQVQLNGGAAHLDLPHPHHPTGKLWHRGSAPRHGWRRVKGRRAHSLTGGPSVVRDPASYFSPHQSRCASVTDDSAGRSAQSDCQRKTGESCPARALWSRTPSYDGKTRKCFFIVRAHGEQPARGRISSVGVLVELWHNAGFEGKRVNKKKPKKHKHKLMWCNSLFLFEHENYFNIF